MREFIDEYGYVVLYALITMMLVYFVVFGLRGAANRIDINMTNSNVIEKSWSGGSLSRETVKTSNPILLVHSNIKLTLDDQNYNTKGYALNYQKVIDGVSLHTREYCSNGSNSTVDLGSNGTVAYKNVYKNYLSFVDVYYRDSEHAINFNKDKSEVTISISGLENVDVSKKGQYWVTYKATNYIKATAWVEGTKYYKKIDTNSDGVPDEIYLVENPKQDVSEYYIEYLSYSSNVPVVVD